MSTTPPALAIAYGRGESIVWAWCGQSFYLGIGCGSCGVPLG